MQHVVVHHVAERRERKKEKKRHYSLRTTQQFRTCEHTFIIQNIFFLRTLLTTVRSCKTLRIPLGSEGEPACFRKVNQPEHFAQRWAICLPWLGLRQTLLSRVHFFCLDDEHLVEAGQPEEKHGFRPGRRLEQHLVTVTVMLDKTGAIKIPVWITSLDLPKAFDQAHGPALWSAVVDEGLPVHLVWTLQCVYFGQCGEVVGDMG